MRHAMRHARHILHHLPAMCFPGLGQHRVGSLCAGDRPRGGLDACLFQGGVSRLGCLWEGGAVHDLAAAGLQLLAQSLSYTWGTATQRVQGCTPLRNIRREPALGHRSRARSVAMPSWAVRGLSSTSCHHPFVFKTTHTKNRLHSPNSNWYSFQNQSHLQRATRVMHCGHHCTTAVAISACRRP